VDPTEHTAHQKRNSTYYEINVLTCSQQAINNPISHSGDQNNSHFKKTKYLVP
jgi:hypothetical protein